MIKAIVWGVIGGCLGWLWSWISAELLGLRSFVYPQDALPVYDVGIGAIAGFAMASWGLEATIRMFNDFWDTHGPYPQEPDRDPVTRPADNVEKSSTLTREPESRTDGSQ
jgi:hypothetical protein